MIYEILKSIVRVKMSSVFEHLHVALAPAPVVARPAECESRDALSSKVAMDRVRCQLDSKLAKRVGRAMARPDMRRCLQ